MNSRFYGGSNLGRGKGLELRSVLLNASTQGVIKFCEPLFLARLSTATTEASYHRLAGLEIIKRDRRGEGRKGERMRASPSLPIS